MSKAAPSKSRNVMVENEIITMSDNDVQHQLERKWESDFFIAGPLDADDDGFETTDFQTYACDQKELISFDKTLPLPMNTKIYLRYKETKDIKIKDKNMTLKMKKLGRSTREEIYNRDGDGVQLLHIFYTRTNKQIGIWGNGTLNYHLIAELDLEDTNTYTPKLVTGQEIRLNYKGKEGTGKLARHDIEIAYPRDFLQSVSMVTGNMTKRLPNNVINANVCALTGEVTTN